VLVSPTMVVMSDIYVVTLMLDLYVLHIGQISLLRRIVMTKRSLVHCFKRKFRW